MYHQFKQEKSLFTHEHTPQIVNMLEQIKYEIATELGVQLGPDTTSRLNGTVGGYMVRRMVEIAERSLVGNIYH